MCTKSLSIMKSRTVAKVIVSAYCMKLWCFFVAIPRYKSCSRFKERNNEATKTTEEITLGLLFVNFSHHFFILNIRSMSCIIVYN